MRAVWQSRRKATSRLGARLQAQPGRADQARQGAARHSRRAARADRAGLRGRRRGRHGPPAVVGPLPRQAEDRHVHAADQGAGGADLPRRPARGRRGVEPLRQGRRRALHPPEHPAALARPDEAARRLRASRRRGRHDRRRLRRHGAQHHRLPRAGNRGRRALRRVARRPRRRRPLLRQPRLGEPAAQAQVLDLRVRRSLQRAGDQLHLADRHRARRWPRGLRRDRRRRPRLGAADRARHGHLRSEGAGERDPRRDHERVVGGSEVPRLAREGAPQVHGRRHRPRGNPRARRDEARPQARGLQARVDRRRAVTSHGRARAEAGRAVATSASRCTSA